MSRVLSDLSQLTKAMIKPSEAQPKPAPKVVNQEEAQQSREDADAAAVLAYFARSPQKASRSPRVAPRGVAVADRPVAPEAALKTKDAALAAFAVEKAAHERRIAELERQLAEEREAHIAAIRERDRLQGELRKCGENAPVGAPVVAAPVARVEPTKPTQGILVAPAMVVVFFPCLLCVQVVETLLDGLGTAERSGRERRAEILRYVLAANQSSGELERRRAELRQILKDAGYYNDPKPLERLGLRLISGRTHWKLQYANVRVVMSKTPSDYRANLNNGSEIANRCF